MNTSKQVNVMIGLLFLVVVAFGLYFIWDRDLRAGDAREEQVLKNAERGAFLFARNCRVCHGVTGRGTLENPNLPGLTLRREDRDDLRFVDPETGDIDTAKLREIQARFTDTMECGRVGTLMPPWHIDNGGPLNDFQIEQLVALITGATSDIIPQNPDAISEEAWEKVPEFAEHGDTIGKLLTRDIDETVIVLRLNDVVGLAPDSFLRIEDEVVLVREVPPATELAAAVLVGDRAIQVKDVSGFEVGMTIAIDQERLRIVSISDNSMAVDRGVEGTSPQYHKPTRPVTSTSTEVLVERGAFGTQAAPHAAGSEVFAGPIPPPTEPVTGADAFVCGQRAVTLAPAGPPAPAPSPGQPERPGTAQPVVGEPEPVTGNLLEIETGDNFFVKNNFKVSVGQEVTIRVTNTGQALHNLRLAGLDGQWNTADDVAVPTDGTFLEGGQSAEGTFRLDQEAVLVFRCDVHPTQMWGQISVAAQ